MNTREKLEKINYIHLLIERGNERISLRNGFIQQLDAQYRTQDAERVRLLNQCTERALQRLKTSLSEKLFDLYLNYASTDECFTDCKKAVDTIEGFYHERQMAKDGI